MTDEYQWGGPGRTHGECVRLCLLMLLWAGLAQAHEVGLSRGRYEVSGAEVTATLTLARSEPVEVEASALSVAGDGAPCPGAVQTRAPVGADGVEVRLRYACPSPPTSVEVTFALLDRLAPGHRHLAWADTGAGPAETVVRRGRGTFTLRAGRPTASPTPSAAGFVALGVEHILLGFDHLVFVLALVLVGGRLRDLLTVVTAFTVGHSVTLALAALGVWTPSGTVIEPLIALSVAYVGAENFLAADASKRWRITAPFGLVHGFGFAGALADIGLPPDGRLLSLLAFNVGVEAGQIAVLLPIVPFVWWARGRPLYDRRVLPALSTATVAVGLLWFFERTLG